MYFFIFSFLLSRRIESFKVREQTRCDGVLNPRSNLTAEMIWWYQISIPPRHEGPQQDGWKLFGGRPAALFPYKKTTKIRPFPGA
jgi:hypothetical protein